MLRTMTLCFIAVMLITISVTTAAARDLRGSAHEPEAAFPDTTTPSIDPPNAMACVHNQGYQRFCVTNHGVLGSQWRDYYDCETGERAESFEFPAGSYLEYLFFGGLWVGAVIADDTLVSIGVDGWYWNSELWPCGDPDCEIEKRSRMPASPYYDPSAISDLDHLTEYTDTLDDPAYTGHHWDGTPHVPLGIEVSQRSYSWGTGDTSKFVIVEYALKAMGAQPLTDTYVGIFIDGDVFHWQSPAAGWSDDVSGHRTFFPNLLGCDSIRYAWVADNDGDPYSGYFDYTSPTGALGVALLGTGAESDVYSFNWWRSDGNPLLDWGPWLSDNAYYSFPYDNLGTPVGDPDKYFLMSNGEIDYDQLEAAVDYTSEGWLGPTYDFIANGEDTKFLLSFGPVDIIPGDSVEFAVAFVSGDSVHVNPSDFEDLYDPDDPGPFQATLDYSALEQKLTLAKLLYDHSYTFPDTGDVNWDFQIDIDDIVGLILHVYNGGLQPPYLPVCDVNCDGLVDLDDIIYMLDFVFRHGPPPGEC